MRLFVVLLTVPAPVRAETVNDAAYQRHDLKARELLRTKDRRGAIREYKAAWIESHDPRSLFNIGYLHRQLAIDEGSLEDARRSVDALVQYIDEFRAANHIDAPQLKTAERYRFELEAKFGPALMPNAPRAPPASATPHTSIPEAAPQQPQAPTAPTPAVRIATPATSAERPTSQPSLPPTVPTSREASAPRRSTGQLLVGGILLGVGAAAAGTGAGLLAHGNSADTRTETGFLESNKLQPERTSGVILLTVGGLALVAGLVVVVIPPRVPRPVAIRLMPTPGGFIAQGKF